MFAAGLSLIFGVMRLVNIAHGDLIVLAAYVALVATASLGVNPLVSLVIVVPVMAVIGYVLQRGLLNRTLGDDLLPPLLVTFGLSVIIQNGLLEIFTADSFKLNAGAIEIESIPVGGGLAIGVLPLIQFALAVAVIGGLQWLFYRTALGRAFRATSDDQSVAQLMGLDNRHVFGLAMALSLAIVADRRRASGRALEFRSGDRPGAADLRIRGGHHWRARQHVGHAARRRHSRGRADDRRAARSGLESAGGPYRISGRAGASSARACFPRCKDEWRPRRASPRHRAGSGSLSLSQPCSGWRRRRSGPIARVCGCSPRSTPMSRWQACGICSRVTPASFRSASRPMSGSAPI